MTLYRLARSNIRGLRHIRELPSKQRFLGAGVLSVRVVCAASRCGRRTDSLGVSGTHGDGHVPVHHSRLLVLLHLVLELGIRAVAEERVRPNYAAGSNQKADQQDARRRDRVIGSTALMAGMGLGFLLFKLMLMAMSWILQVKTPIRFAIVPGAAFLTVGVYGILFAVIALMTMRTIKSSEVIQLIRASQKPKAPPRFSKILVCLSAICLGAGYYLAWTANGHTLVLLMLPVVAIVSLGTYLFFTQSSVAAFRWLQRRKGIYYRDLNLLTISDMVFKMKENAQVLSAVAILMAVVLTSTSTIYTFRDLMMKDVESVRPYALAFAVNNEESSERLSSLARANSRPTATK